MFKPVRDLLSGAAQHMLYRDERGERFVLVPVADYERLTGKQVDSSAPVRDTGEIKQKPWHMPLDEEVGVDDVPL